MFGEKMKRSFTIFFKVVLFLVLTVLTQTGGIVYIGSEIIDRMKKRKYGFRKPILFVGLYLIFTFLIVPIVAPLLGREKVKHSHRIKPANYLTVLLNRNYVSPQLNQLLIDADRELLNTNIQIRYLDANFPFFDHFPLLPHLSHKDGKKIDLSLIYFNW